MARADLSIKSAEKARNEITKRQTNEVRMMYKRAAKSIVRKSAALQGKDNISSVLRQQYLNELEVILKKEYDKLSIQLGLNIKATMTATAEAVIKDSNVWITKVGMKIDEAWMHLPNQIVQNISTGKIYDSGWSLSKRIWGINEKTMKDIHSVIAEGVAQNKGSFDIAKDLEKYVNPNAVKKWDWSKVYPGTAKKIDYNAQRLARTLVQHSYQQSFKETTEKNPWVEKYKWLSAFSARSCEICKNRDGQLFDKDKLPMDHPMGLCTWVAVIDKDWDEITDDIAKWYKSPDGTYPNIDSFAKSISNK